MEFYRATLFATVARLRGRAGALSLAVTPDDAADDAGFWPEGVRGPARARAISGSA